MSQDQADYVTDALEMMGIVEPKQIVTEISGFIPVFEIVLHHYKDYMTALVFGRMWQYCGMSDGVCKASLDRIGNDLEVSATTVMRHAEKLVEDKYLIDTTPDRRNAPHEYIDGRRVEMKSRFTAGIAESRPTVIKSDATVIKSQLIKQDNTKINKDMLDMLLEQEQKAQPIRNACLMFETAMLGCTVSQWPWDSNAKWQKFAKWVAAQEQGQFKDYAEWRKRDGKYQAMSNNKIRQDPQMFMDTGWPTFLAHVSMYGETKSRAFAL